MRFIDLRLFGAEETADEAQLPRKKPPPIREAQEETPSGRGLTKRRRARLWRLRNVYARRLLRQPPFRRLLLAPHWQ